MIIDPISRNDIDDLMSDTACQETAKEYEIAVEAYCMDLISCYYANNTIFFKASTGNLIRRKTMLRQEDFFDYIEYAKENGMDSIFYFKGFYFPLDPCHRLWDGKCGFMFRENDGYMIYDDEKNIMLPADMKQYYFIGDDMIPQYEVRTLAKGGFDWYEKKDFSLKTYYNNFLRLICKNH